MADSESRLIDGARQGLVTGLAAWISFGTSSLIGLHEGYWAAISSIVVLQSDLRDTRNAGLDRFMGTAIGGVIGWGCAACWHGQVWVYAIAVALTIFACWVSGIGNAGRLAAVAVSVIVLIPRDEPVWRVALYRFFEVAWGIAVSVILETLMARLTKRTAA